MSQAVVKEWFVWSIMLDLGEMEPSGSERLRAVLLVLDDRRSEVLSPSLLCFCKNVLLLMLRPTHTLFPCSCELATT